MTEVKNTKAAKKLASKKEAQAKKIESKCTDIQQKEPKQEPKTQVTGILKFQACDEKSFFVHKTPCVLGSEDPQKWKLKMAQQDIDKDLMGHSIMDQFQLAKFKREVKEETDKEMFDLLSKVETKVSFSKCKNISKYHAVLISSESSFQLTAIQPLFINNQKVTFKDGPKQLFSSNMIQFPCETCTMPHIYHLIMPKDEVDQPLTFNRQVFVPLLQKYQSNQNFSRFLDMLEMDKDPTDEQKQHFKSWSCEKLRTLKRYMLMYGYGRWGKIRKASQAKDGLLASENEKSMRPYANLLLVYLAQCLEELPKLQQKTLELIQVKEADYVVYAHPHDFIAKEKAPESFQKQAPQTAKRILSLTQLTELVRDYKTFKENTDEQETNGLPLLNFIASSHLAKLPKPTDIDTPWGRKDDCELLLEVYEDGTNKIDAAKLARMTKVISLVLCHKKRPFDFSQKIRELSGFSFDEKMRIYEILINFGVPTVVNDENKEDWELLKTLLYKQVQGTEALPVDDHLKTAQLEKFVNQMDVVSTKILKDYASPVNDILKQWKEEDKEDSNNKTESDSDSDEEKRNDFHIDKDRIRAAHFWEKTNKRLTFDPDSDGFNFGYERALTFKVRVNLLRIIRKEILSNNERFWNDAQEALQAMNTTEAREKCKLPENWKMEIHDKQLLKAVSENGISFLQKLKENKEYGFADIRVSRKRLQRRLEHLCFFFKNLLPKYKKIYEKEKQTKANLEMGTTKIDLKKKFTKINLQRDLEGNIIYPIQVIPSLQILNLGIVEWERPAYHSEKNIFPIGWKSVREGTSMFHLGQKDTYICEILDGGQKPLFKVTASEDPNNPIMQNSASGVWIEICKRINELQGGGRTKVTVSGPDRYGLTEPGVTQLLACLPNAEKCSKFNPNYTQQH